MATQVCSSNTGSLNTRQNDRHLLEYCQIDLFVDERYGLTEEEILIIRFRRSLATHL